VWNEVVKKYLEHPEMIEMQAEELRDTDAEQIVRVDLEKAQREIAQCKRAQAKFTARYSALMAGDTPEGSFSVKLIEQEVAKLEADKLNWAKKRIAAQELLDRQELSRDRLAYVQEYLKRIRGDADLSDPLERRRMLEGLEVQVFANGADVYVKIGIYDEHGRSITYMNVYARVLGHKKLFQQPEPFVTEAADDKVERVALP
jgi:hypothetical protein